MRVTCTRRLQFCAGHRVLGHEGKCAALHGHNYVALFTAEAPELDSLGRVVDFSELKSRIGSWILNKWDHGMILFENDVAAMKACDMTHPNKIFVMPTNPTAENMAKYLLLGVCPAVLIGTGITVTRVRIWETENCYATATL